MNPITWTPLRIAAVVGIVLLAVFFIAQPTPDMDRHSCAAVRASLRTLATHGYRITDDKDRLYAQTDDVLVDFLCAPFAGNPVTVAPGKASAGDLDAVLPNAAEIGDLVTGVGRSTAAYAARNACASAQQAAGGVGAAQIVDRFSFGCAYDKRRGKIARITVAGQPLEKN